MRSVRTCAGCTLLRMVGYGKPPVEKKVIVTSVVLLGITPVLQFSGLNQSSLTAPVHWEGTLPATVKVVR
ncbi:hypothetical protein ACFQT0_25625 [Hymenobacter humi]|uniref:Uncharacterized protein n=1 Tax=Hymenobacter humi TaxID=1411620 RepID=A0ABW2UBU7_9BACT